MSLNYEALHSKG